MKFMKKIWIFKKLHSNAVFCFENWAAMGLQSMLTSMEHATRLLLIPFERFDFTSSDVPVCLISDCHRFIGWPDLAN